MTEVMPLKPEEIPLLEEFLYQAIFIPSRSRAATQKYLEGART